MRNSALSPAEYQAILVTHLVPMFPGSELQQFPVRMQKEEGIVVLREDAGSLFIWPDLAWDNCFRLVRKTHPFDTEDIKIISKFTKALHEKLPTSRQPFFQFLVDRCSQDSVAWTVQDEIMSDDLLPGILTLFQKWAAETYEGQRISVAIGVDPRPDVDRISNLHLREIVDKDFSKVLSNGLDTVMVLSPSGHVVEHLALGGGTVVGKRIQPESWTSPRRYLPLAAWAKGGRVALTLNRHGEILVFKDSRLQFAYRRGKWSHFAHSAMIARMSKLPREQSLMRAVYASCLDISFARTGGCIAVVKRQKTNKITEFLNSDDLLIKCQTPKSVLMEHLTGKTFDQIPRPIREEMAAMDGAIVLDHEGKVIAAGAIVKLEGGSDGGGRKAAAKALSRLGLAIKISSDGGITAFTDQGLKKSPDIAFEVST